MPGSPPSPVLDAPAKAQVVDGRIRLNPEPIKLLRRQLGLSQSLLAERARQQGRPVSIASIKRVELGAPVLYRTALHLAELLSVQVDALMFTTGRPAAAAPAHGRADPLVGRVGECQLFQTLLTDTVQQQRGSALYLRAPAGMGKTRLVQEWQSLARGAGVRVMSGQVTPRSIRTHNGLIGGMLQSYLQLAGYLRDPFAAAEQLRQQLRRLGLPETLMLGLAPLMDLPLTAEEERLHQGLPPEERLRVYDRSVLELIWCACREQPLMFVLEDMHFADDLLLDMLCPMIFSTQGSPVIWVLTSRLEKDLLEHKIRPYLPEVPIKVLNLPPLGTQEAQTLAQRMGQTDTAHVAECIVRSRGNPLFLTELLRHPDRETVPPALSQLLQSKLQQLPPQDQEAVLIAAAAGAEFPLKLLRSLLDDPGYVPTEPLAQHLFRACGIRSYAFTSDLIMQAVTLATPLAQRRQIHERLAAYHQASDVRRQALHLVQAGHPSAASALMTAIGHCCDHHAYEEAQELVAQHARLEPSPREPHRLGWLQARVALGQGRAVQARELLRQALDQAPTDADRLAVVVTLAQALVELEESQELEDLLIRYAPLAQALANPILLSQIYQLQGQLLGLIGRQDKAVTLYTAARQQSRLAQQPRQEALSLCGLADTQLAQSHMRSAALTLQQALVLCEQHGLTDVEAGTRTRLALARLYMNETLGALNEARVATEMAQRVGHQRAELQARLSAGELYLNLNQTTSAGFEFDTALQLARAIDATRFEPQALEGLARLRLLGGDQEVARRLAHQAWAQIERQGLKNVLGLSVLGTLALCENHAGRQQQALTLGLGVMDAGYAASSSCRFLVSAAEAELRAGRVDEAARLADRLQALTRSEPFAWADHHVQLIRAHVAWQVRPDPSARQCLETLIESGLLAGIAHASPLLHELLA